jgi:hypothetical protein
VNPAETPPNQGEAPAEEERPLTPEESWVKDWFLRLDPASRTNAITELRTDQERMIAEINRELTESIRQFSRLILELWALREAPGAADNATLAHKYDEARVLEMRTRDLEERLESARKVFEAFERMERTVNRMR